MISRNGQGNGEGASEGPVLFPPASDTYGTFGEAKHSSTGDRDTETTEEEDYKGDLRIGISCFVASLLLFSQVPAVVKLLYAIEPNTFNACSILCASNTVGAVSLPIFFYNELSWKSLKRISKREALAILASSVLYSGVGPALQLNGLEYIDIPTMAVIQRLETVNLVLLAYLFANPEGKRVSRWCCINCSLIVAVVLMYAFETVVREKGSYWINFLGCLYIIMSGWAYSTSLLIMKTALKRASPGQVTVLRAVLGAFIYHFMAILTGQSDLDRLYSPTLWQYMIWYGLVYVFLGQWMWTVGLQTCPPSILATGISALFPLQVLWSFVLLPGWPTDLQIYLSLFLVFVVISASLEVYNQGSAEETPEINSNAITSPPSVAHTSRRDIISLKGM